MLLNFPSAPRRRRRRNNAPQDNKLRLDCVVQIRIEETRVRERRRETRRRRFYCETFQ